VVHTGKTCLRQDFIIPDNQSHEHSYFIKDQVFLQDYLLLLGHKTIQKLKMSNTRTVKAGATGIPSTTGTGSKKRGLDVDLNSSCGSDSTADPAIKKNKTASYMKNEEVVNLLNNINSKLDKMDDIQKSVKDIEKSVTDIKEEIAKTSSNVETLQNDVHTLFENLEKVDEQINSLKFDKDAIETEVRKINLIMSGSRNERFYEKSVKNALPTTD